MLEQYNSSVLLNLKDVIVDEVHQFTDETHIYIHLMEQEVRICPCCGSTHCHIHDHRYQILKDLPAYGKKTYLHWDKRRYACQDCGKRFYESNSIQPKYYHSTSRLISEIIFAFKDSVSATHIAKEHNVSTQTALRYFDTISFKCKNLPNVVSIDEFKGNASHQKYQTIVTNPNKKDVLDILPDRFENHLIEYFLQFNNRNTVEYFIIDMNPHFLRVGQTCFKNATIVVDKYHVIRQVAWAVEHVRKNEQQNLSVKNRRYFKKSRKLMYKKRSELTEDEMNSLTYMLEAAPRMADAYRLYWRFLKVMYSPDSVTGKELLGKWLFDAEVSNLAEFKDAVAAIHNWDKFIINSFDCSYTNGYTEGCNNRTKVLKRVCYGIQRYDRLKKRIMFLAS